MIVYLVDSKIPEINIDADTEAFGSLKEAKKYFNSRVAEIKQQEEEGNDGWCNLVKVELSKNLPTKQLILAILSRRSYAEKIVNIDSYSS